jgi:hypothetical protein
MSKNNTWYSVPTSQEDGQGIKYFGWIDLKFSEFLEVASTWRDTKRVSRFGSGVNEASIL